MKTRLWLLTLALLFALPLSSGCTIANVIDFFYPWGGPNEPGISKRERRARLEEEQIQQMTEPFNSDRQALPP